MEKPIHFDNPPISEALIDIRVALPKEVTLEQLAVFQEDIKVTFPIRKEKYSGTFQIKTGAAPEVAATSNRLDGFLFHSNDNKKIVQARLDGFTFNKLRPYSDWETFSGEARLLWEHYRSIAKPTNVLRVGLRYINRIELPLPFIDFKEYVLTIPDIAPGMPNGLSGFFMQLAIPNNEINAHANIIETMENKFDKGTLPFILDIDVFRDIILDPLSQEIWNIFDQLRGFKNQIFLSSLTDKTKGLFK